MIEQFAAAASGRGLTALSLESRVELSEIHAAFIALGFAKTGETRHPGYNRTTGLVFRKPV